MHLRFVLLLIPVVAAAQLTTGFVEGSVRDEQGQAMQHFALSLAGRSGFRTAVETNSDGRFQFSAPYGEYSLLTRTQSSQASSVRLSVEPIRTTRLDLVIDNSGQIRQSTSQSDGWVHGKVAFPQGFSVQSTTEAQYPAGLSVPYDFEGLADNRPALISERAFSWTASQFKLQGLDATDSYQPGRPEILPAVESLRAIAVPTGSALTISGSYGPEVSSFLNEPVTRWHGAVGTANTGSPLASDNLPRSPGMLRQPERYSWLTRDHLEIGGPVTSWADLFGSVAGQWSSQTVPVAAPGQDQNTRMLYGNLMGDIRVGSRDRIDIEYVGSRVSLSNWGVPAGLEALTSRRMSPEFDLPYGFPDEAESDRYNFVQTGWTHQQASGIVELRYGYSVAHLNTWPANETTPTQSRIELLTSTVTGLPPLGNRATRPRHEIAVAWQHDVAPANGWLHHLAAGGNWELSSPGNRMAAPSDLNLITVAEAPAYVVAYNTPVDSTEKLQAASVYGVDHVTFGNRLSIDAGILADISRGSVPTRNSSGASDGSIAWQNASPRAAFSWRVPRLRGLVLSGGYRRSYFPLAGRLLDYENPNFLGGSVYQWIDHNADGWFQSNEQGPLLMRFGGPYSSISRSLERPYSDEFQVSARVVVGRQISAGVQLFRRDEKHRIVAIDTGLGAGAFSPSQVVDPGPDGIVGTFDDQRLTVYAQNPATLGQDRYTLTNAPGLRELNTGFTADVGAGWSRFMVRAAFTAEKAWGPTNPGNAVFENDPDVIGTLFIDPNSTDPTLARSYVDRAYLGKVQALYRTPAAFGGLELASIAHYMDGLPFARELLVSGLPQGPFLIPATVRGSPEGGNRAQYVLGWNLRVAREFRLQPGRLLASVDALNVTNSGRAIAQSDLTGSEFNLRLPTAIQPARFIRFGLVYSF